MLAHASSIGFKNMFIVSPSARAGGRMIGVDLSNAGLEDCTGCGDGNCTTFCRCCGTGTGRGTAGGVTLVNSGLTGDDHDGGAGGGGLFHPEGS